MKVQEIKLALEKNKKTHLQFALIDDAEKELYKGISIFNQSKSKVTKEISNFKQAIPLFENALKMYENFIDKAKEIGVEYKKGSEGVNYAKQYIKEVNQIYDKLNQI